MDNMGIYMDNNTQSPFEEVKKMNFFQRVIGIILSPAETMKNLIVKPRIVFPIIIIALGLLSVYLLNFQQYKDLLRETTELALENSNLKMSLEQISTQIDLQSAISMVTTPFLTLIVWVAGAAIIFGLIKLFKGKGSFYQFLSITGYAYVIMLLFYIITGVVGYMTNSLALEVPITSVGSLLPKDMKGNFLYGISKGLEIFDIWRIIVTGIGITLVSKLSKTKVYSLLFGMFAVKILFLGVSELIASMFK